MAEKKILSKSRDAHSILEALIEQATQLGRVGKVKFSIPAHELGKTPESYEPVYLVVDIKTSWDAEEVIPEFEENYEGEESEDGESSDTDTKH